MSMFERILEEKFKYFVQNIEPYYFVLYTYQNKALVIEVKNQILEILLDMKNQVMYYIHQCLVQNYIN